MLLFDDGFFFGWYGPQIQEMAYPWRSLNAHGLAIGIVGHHASSCMGPGICCACMLCTSIRRYNREFGATGMMRRNIDLR